MFLANCIIIFCHGFLLQLKRIPLHLCVCLKERHLIWPILQDAGADPNLVDVVRSSLHVLSVYSCCLIATDWCYFIAVRVVLSLSLVWFYRCCSCGFITAVDACRITCRYTTTCES